MAKPTGRFPKVQISRKGRRIRCYKRIATAKAECSNYGVNLRPFQNFLFEQLFRNLMEQAKIRAQKGRSPLIALLDNALDLSVDLDGRGLGIVGLLGKISSQKNFFFLSPKSHWPELFTHSPLAHHPSHQIGGFLDIVSCAGRDLLEYELFGDASAKYNDQIIEQIFPRGGIGLVQRQLRGQSWSQAARLPPVLLLWRWQAVLAP